MKGRERNGDEEQNEKGGEREKRGERERVSKSEGGIGINVTQRDSCSSLLARLHNALVNVPRIFISHYEIPLLFKHYSGALVARKRDHPREAARFLHGNEEVY